MRDSVLLFVVLPLQPPGNVVHVPPMKWMDAVGAQQLRRLLVVLLQQSGGEDQLVAGWTLEVPVPRLATNLRF